VNNKRRKVEMSTRSMILEEQKDGRYLGIYCHYDGYLEYNGRILMTHYKSRRKVRELLELGDLSRLAPRLKPRSNRPHNFYSAQSDVCVFFGRDRGEIATNAEYVTLEELNRDADIEFTYVYGLDNKWRYFEYRQLNDGLKEIGLSKRKGE
jgi:hypothetical protein